MSIDRLIFLIDGVLRRWVFLLLPAILSIPIAFLVWKTAPIKYETQSTILLLSANRVTEGGPGVFPRQSALEQVGVIEAWLKSEPVLMELLPQIVEDVDMSNPQLVGVQIALLRRALTLQLIGYAALEIRLEGAVAKGLARKLEIIVARVLEGLIYREAGILSAHQMIITHRGEVVTELDSALTKLIVSSGLNNDEVRAKLRALERLKQQASASPPSEPTRLASRAADRTSLGSTDQVTQLRAEISSDPAVADKIERLHEQYTQAQAAYAAAESRGNASSGSYVTVFDAPEKLMVIGRPSDPILGNSRGKKLAIGIMLVAGLLGLGLALTVVFYEDTIRRWDDFEETAGLPVLARLPRARFARRTAAARS